MIGITNTNTGQLTICCLSHAADMIGVERSELYRMIKAETLEYRHFIIHPDVKTIPFKSRGSMNTLRR
jgi:hypothetical protein